MYIEPAEIFAVIMLFIGFYGLITTNNILKSTIYIIFMEVACIVFFLSIGYSEGIAAPIGPNLIGLESFELVADPFPQALMITAIVIGLSVTTIMLVMTITLIREFKSTDWDVIKARAKHLD